MPTTLLAAILLVFIPTTSYAQTAIPFSTFRDQLLAGNVRLVQVSGDSLQGNFNKPISTSTGQVTVYRTDLTPGVTGQWAFLDWLTSNRNGATVDMDNNAGSLLAIFLPILPWVAVFLLVWMFAYRTLRKTNQARPVYIVPSPPISPPPPPSNMPPLPPPPGA